MLNLNNLNGFERDMLIQCQSGDLESLKKFGSRPSVTCNWNFNNNYPLRVATENGHVEIVELLISKGADVNSAKGTALQLACNNQDIPMLNCLLEHGATYGLTSHFNPDLLSGSIRDGNHVFFNIIMSKYDLETIHAIKYREFTEAINQPAINGKTEFLKTFYEAGFDLSYTSCLPLVLSASHGTWKIFIIFYQLV
ncbi:MAG: ankyrin repeat domain-containing protein [Endozoicomonadaceae bacterium]|nr:ankyrin repeat domain-containing protein [Endozoicomonadaceae bacterium]